MSDEPRDPQLDTLLDLAVEIALDRIRGVEIGRVVSYNAQNQTATVQPVVTRSHLDLEGRRVTTPPVAIPNAIVWFFGAGGGRVTFPLDRGDYGLIAHCSVSNEQWKRRGGVVDPISDRRHHESDAIFIPGVHPPAKPPTSAPTDAVVVHSGSLLLKLGGPTGTQKTLMADSFLSALDGLIDEVATAVGGISGGTAAGTAITTAKGIFAAAILRDAYKTSITEVK